ncbi:MAG: DUF1800 family protein [Gammaproteobacteria bacterium]|nr:DUF1800 family protein [Gammaproteobacteria bacterium]
MTPRLLTGDDVRHLMRRLGFAAQPHDVDELTGLNADAAFSALWSRSAAFDAAPNPGGTADPASTASLRQAWMQHLTTSPAGLRENLALFLNGLFGSSAKTVNDAKALAVRSELLREACMGRFGDLLERLVLDPAMMLQTGLDGHGPFRVSDRPAVLILENWSVGAGHYQPADVAALSSALTGWRVEQPGGNDAGGLRESVFDTANFEAGPKTILGTTADFDARSAMRLLADLPATARRVSRRLLDHLGVDDAPGTAAQAMEQAWADSDGAMEPVLRAAVLADSFWSEASRWSLIKSPVHLAAGVCRQLEIEAPPLAALDHWCDACGQRLFETPDNGESGWPGGRDWVTPAERLALRYELFAALGGRIVGESMAPPHALEAAIGMSASEIIERLDAAPGLDTRQLITQARPGANDSAARLIAAILATPHYQLA